MLQSNPKPCRIKNVKEGGTELWCEGLTIKEYSLRGRTVGYCIRFHWWHICLCCCVTPFSSIFALPLLCTICIVQGVRKCHMTVTVTRVCVYRGECGRTRALHPGNCIFIYSKVWLKVRTCLSTMLLLLCGLCAVLFALCCVYFNLKSAIAESHLLMLKKN